MAKMTDITCPEDCDIADIPAVSFEDCNPSIFSSELQEMYVGRSDAVDFDDVTAAEQWTARVSQDGTVPEGSTYAVKDLLRKLTIIGDIPAPQKTTRQISGGREVVTEVKYVVNFEIDDVTDENWQFAQKVQCGKGAYPVKAWPVSKSGHVLGGDSGISGKMAIDHILDRGADGIMRLVGTLTFTTTSFPNRDEFPLAA